MEIVDSIVIGAGQAGLAMSASLRMRGIGHVVLERGRVAERWRSERWDSFRLLSPNWQTRLPGHHYRGVDPDGFMTGPQLVAMFETYAAEAPVRTGVAVSAVRAAEGGYRVSTSAGELRSGEIIVATGDLDLPRIPAVGVDLPPNLLQLHSSRYRNPAQLPAGAVLVVGAGPSGQQIADELARAGRRVHLAVGRHQMLPRRYRGQDTYWWMDRLGMLSRTVDTLANVSETRAPNAVLAGGTDDLDLHRLVRSGVLPHGRLTGVHGTTVTFAADLERTFAEAEAASLKFRATVDEYVGRSGLDAPAATASRQAAPWLLQDLSVLDLQAEGLRTVIWATGFTADRSWLPPAALSEDGSPQQIRGISALSGLYFLGLKWQHRRSSHTIDGVGRDADYVADHIAARIAERDRLIEQDLRGVEVAA
jgi:putative flavoprotein involved in K+ transport